MSTLDRDDEAEELDVACYYGRPTTEWTEETVRGGLLAFYEPCPICFDDGEPPLGSTVLRAYGSDGKLLHRPVEVDRGDGIRTDGGQSTGDTDRLQPSVYASSIEGCIYADCPTCTNTMRLGEFWADLILNEDKEIPRCPECDSEQGDDWADDADVIVDWHELWACMGEELDLDQEYPEMEI